MENWFEVKVKYEKIDERGAVKKVTEPYMVDALTFTEAEARATSELEAYLSGEYLIWDISRSNVTELFPLSPSDKAFDASDLWFKFKVGFITIDEEKGTEKVKNTYMLVQAMDIKTARENITEAMSGQLSDYVITEIKETKIMDVFPYSADALKNEQGEVVCGGKEDK